MFARWKNSFQKVFMFLLVTVIFGSLQEYMDELNVQTTTELGDSNFVRYVSMRYYFYEMNTSPIYYMFGAGFPGQSALGTLISILQDDYGFYQEDTGLVGYISKAGFFGLFTYLLIIIKIFRNMRYVDMGLMLFLLVILFICVFKFWGNYPSNLGTFAIFMYLVDYSVRENKLKKISV